MTSSPASSRVASALDRGTSTSRARFEATRRRYAITSSRASVERAWPFSTVTLSASQMTSSLRDAIRRRSANALMPLRVLFRRAIEDGDLVVNPCVHLRLPAVRGRRERVAAPEEARRLLAALPERDRPVWATALYAGLRGGELMALRWGDVHLAAGVIRVERSYDDKGRVEIEPKSRAGRRTVPIVGALRDVLVAYKASQDRDHGLVFGSGAETPFVPSNLWRRAQRAWKRASLDPIGLHEARHTFASVLIAAGVNAKAITTYMDHASIQTTYDLYGKLMPGSESEAAALVDAYLARADTQSRLDQLGATET